MSILEQQPNSQTTSVRVAVALKMPLEREAISQAMTILRPNWEVRDVIPVDLNAYIPDERPDVVICTELTDVVESYVPQWFLLHPYGSARCVVAVNGVRQEQSNMPLTSILDHIDRVYG